MNAGADAGYGVFDRHRSPSAAAKRRYRSSQTNTIFETTSVGSSHFLDQIRLALDWTQRCQGGCRPTSQTKAELILTNSAPGFAGIPQKAGRNLERVCNLQAEQFYAIA